MVRLQYKNGEGFLRNSHLEPRIVVSSVWWAVLKHCWHALWMKGGGDGTRSSYVKDRIQHAKRIMKPFFLRRLKSEVLTHLPTKTASVEVVPMGQQQHTMYFDRVAKYKKRAAEVNKFKPTSLGRSRTEGDGIFYFFP